MPDVSHLSLVDPCSRDHLVDSEALDDPQAEVSNADVGLLEGGGGHDADSFALGGLDHE